MKVNGLLIVLSLLVMSCGALKVSPKGCQGEGIWSGPINNRVDTSEDHFTKVYYVWNFDYEVRLKEFLDKRKIDCREIKKMRINISSVFFVKRKLTVFIQK